MFAPRLIACSYSSRINAPPPSPSTKPSRSRSNGREAVSGESLRRKGFQTIETSHSHFIYCCFGTTCNKCIGFTQTNQVKRIDDCVGRRSTSRYCNIIRTAQTILDGNMPCRNVSDHFRNKERVEFRSSVTGEEILCFILERFKTSDSRSPDHTDTIQVRI